MSPTKPALEEVSGFLGVGSLLLLGIFLIVDGLTGFWILVEHYAKASSFAILFTVPLLVISYVLGLFSSLATEAVLSRFVKRSLGANLYATTIVLGRDHLLARYAEVERHSRLLYGCTLAFLLLAVGSLLERSNLSGYESVGVACFLVGLALSLACPLLARRLQVDLESHVNAVKLAAAPSDA